MIAYLRKMQSEDEVFTVVQSLAFFLYLTKKQIKDVFRMRFVVLDIVRVDLIPAGQTLMKFFFFLIFLLWNTIEVRTGKSNET